MSPSQGMRPRAVFDCNTYIQAAAFESGPAAACLHLVESGDVELFISKPIFAELQRVLSYKQVLSIGSNLTPTRIGAFLDRLSFRATFVRGRIPHVINYPRDPNDEPYVDLAAFVDADYLVTRDKDLLDLMTGHSLTCKQFRQKTHPLRVVDPATFLRIARPGRPK